MLKKNSSLNLWNYVVLIKVLKSILIKLRLKFKKHRGKVKLDLYMNLIKNIVIKKGVIKRWKSIMF